MSDTGGPDLDRLLDPDLPHTFRGLDPEAVQRLLGEAVESLRAAHRREEELRATITSLEAELAATVRADAEAVLDDAKRRGRQMVAEAQTVRRRIMEDLIRRRKVLRRQIEQLRVGRERLLEAYEVVGQTVEEATSELGVSLVAATAAAERAGRRLGPDEDEISEDELHAMEAEVEAARAAGLPILDPPTAAERRADAAAAQPPAEEGDEEAEEEEVPPLVEVEPVVAAFEEMRVLGPADDEAEEAPELVLVEDPPDEAAVEVDEAEVLPLFDRLRSEDDDEPEPEAEPPLPDLIEAEPDPDAEDAPDPVALLAHDLARRLRRALADEQNQVLDRLRLDTRGQLGLDDLLAEDDARVARLATAIEPQLREAVAAADAADLAAELAGDVADGIHADVRQQVERSRADEDPDLARPVREAFRAWRTDRILPLATAVAAEALTR